MLLLSGCAQAGLSAADAYRVGCPALDAVAASGSAAGKVTQAALEGLKNTGTVTGDPAQWLDVAIKYLNDPAQVSEADKKFIKDGCAANGYTLQNFK